MCESLREVLVAAPAEADEDQVGVEVARAGEGMRRLERGDDPFRAREVAERGESLLVRRHAVLGAARVAEEGVLRADAGVVEAGGDRMRVGDLAVLVGEHGRARAVENGGPSGAEGRLPDAVVACVGGGSNAIGIFTDFVGDEGVRLIGVEAAGAASLGAGRAGVLHGARSSLLADEDGQILDAHSISAGLDYPGVGPEHAQLRDSGRAEYVTATDDEALAAFHDLCASEGIVPALESSHALARARELDAELVLVCLSGRGDKDLAEVLAIEDGAA